MCFVSSYINLLWIPHIWLNYFCFRPSSDSSYPILFPRRSLWEVKWASALSWGHVACGSIIVGSGIFPPNNRSFTDSSGWEFVSLFLASSFQEVTSHFLHGMLSLQIDELCRRGRSPYQFGASSKETCLRFTYFFFRGNKPTTCWNVSVPVVWKIK